MTSLHTQRRAHRHITLIGVPTDVGASVLGASMGPDALRIAGLAAALRARGLDVHDMGNISGPANPQDIAHEGFRHLAQVTTWNRAVFDAVAHTLTAQRLPLLLGGDHSMTIGSLGAVARHCQHHHRPLRVLWFDAHADANTPATSVSGNLHGMPVACLLGDGPAPLCAVGQPILQPAQLCHVGVRSVDEGERRYLHARAIEVFDMRSIDELGMRAVMQRALHSVHEQHAHVHLSFDLDCLDPDIAPGVSTPVRGGLTYREIQLCMEMLAECGALGSVDVMELNPACDIRNQTARLAVDLLESLFGKSTLARPHP